MPSTHASLYCHAVFSTKNRVPSIAASWRADLHAYIGGILRSLGVVAEAVGGIEDHVHVLASLKAKHRPCDVVREMKAGSSHWVHTTLGLAKFGWQDGYGAFSVSPSRIEAVREYVLRQDLHHRRFGFQEEYVRLLRSSGVAFDEKYLW
jgi:REP element-mobilizing transposase RayT